MVAVIEFELPTEEFALNETMAALSDVHIEIERVVANDPERITPYMWVHTDDFGKFESAIDRDPTVEDVTMLSETDEERSYQMTWTGSIGFIIHLLTDHDGTITHAEGAQGRWHLRVLFPDRESLSQACDSAKEAGFQFDVQKIYGTEDTRRIQYGLTEKQRDTMIAAFEAGYFNVPREVTMTEFAEQQGLSHQAISERFRRATSSLIDSALISSNETEE
jgi:predicted DNA binding protein